MLDCLQIRQKEEEKAVTLKIEECYELYLNGVEMETILFMIQAVYKDGLQRLPVTADQLRDFEKMKDRVVCRLIHAETNQELLEHCPYVPILDLAVVFVLQIWTEKEEQMTCLIQNEHLKIWGVSKEILYPLAMQNAPVLLPGKFRHICEVIGWENIQDDIPKEEMEMYVLTNQMEMYGAVVLLYPGMLKECAKRLNSDLLILPSSIHEVILIPSRGAMVKVDFREMVAEINESDVPPEDILSGNVYFYDREADALCIWNEGKGGEGSE